MSPIRVLVFMLPLVALALSAPAEKEIPFGKPPAKPDKPATNEKPDVPEAVDEDGDGERLFRQF